jgi:hypothetical protein
MRGECVSGPGELGGVLRYAVRDTRTDARTGTNACEGVWGSQSQGVGVALGLMRRALPTPSSAALLTPSR